MNNKKVINPLSSRNSPVAETKLGPSNKSINPLPVSPTQTSFGSGVPDWLGNRKSNALNSYMQDKNNRTTELASDYATKAAGQVPTNEYGIVTDKTSDFSSYFNNQLGAIGAKGKASLATAEAQAQWQQLQGMQEANAGYSINYTPGASTNGNNVGAKAVNLAMTAYQNGTPYVWGGNSLTGGVDCSGLVQQVYKKLGVTLPRTTYEQAKSGRIVSLNSLLPGDLIFYNTGSRDPNGIGSLSHVAIYIGNGKVVEAPGKGKKVQVNSMNTSGTPARAVRPW
ncbi:C40 family peptidase [Streptomyces hebeiensis]